MKKPMKWVAFIFGLLVCYGIGICSFFHFVLPGPDLHASDIKAGQSWASKVEGFEQEVLWVRDGQASIRSTLRPFAPGPPVHVHQTFDEHFRVAKGRLTLWLNGRKQVFEPGSEIEIPRGTPHKPCNETGEEVVLEDDRKATMPVSFAQGLVHLYPAMDKAGSADAPVVLLTISALGSDFDTWLADRPLPAQRFLRWFLYPVAWMGGYV